MSAAEQIRERGILFSAPMVREILAGRKTKTRRVCKPEWLRCLDPEDPEDNNAALALCPHGQIGDHLWVRETWQAIRAATNPETGTTAAIHTPLDILKSSEDGLWTVAYAADPAWPGTETLAERGFSWRPSIFMPRWASRITLEITSVHLERLQDISELDAKEEGAPKVHTIDGMPYRFGFRKLWDEINAERGFPWSANPWVWAIEFRRLP